MKVICTKENLRRGINNCERSVGKNPTLPILGNIMLETEKGLLKITSTNLELGVISYIRGKVEKDGKITVPARVLSGLINNIKEDQITLEEEGTNLKVTTENFKSKLRTTPAEDFPLIPKLDKGEQFKVKGSVLAEGIRRTAPALASLETKLELTGICLIIQNNKLLIAATDGYRLAEKEVKIKKGLETETKLIIPGRSMQEVERIFSEEGKDITITTEENQISFQSDDIYIVSRLIEGQYPDYQQIIPKDFKTRTMLNKEDLTDALKLAGIFSTIQTKDIKVKPGDNKIEINATSGELGEHNASIKADVEGEKEEVTFNYQFLQDGLNNIPEGEIIFSLNGSDGPSLITGWDSKNNKEVLDFRYIVMPIRQ